MNPLYGPDNLPFGVFSVDGGARRVGVRLGDAVLDLAVAGGGEAAPSNPAAATSSSAAVSPPR